MGKLGLGFLGAGGRARDHASIFKEIPGTDLVATCDVVSVKAEKMAKDLGMSNFYTDYEDMLKNKRIDAVVVSTPDHLHAQHSLRCLEAGKHVLTEIPMAYTYEECSQLVDAVRRTGLKFFFGQETRYWNVFAAVKKLVEREEFGDLFYAETEYLHNLSVPIDFFKRTPWRKDQTTMLGGGPHAVDTLRWVIGSELVEVKAYGNRKAVLDHHKDDLTVAIYRAENGCIGRVVVAYGMTRPYSLSVRIYGTEATFEQDSLPWSMSGKISKIPKEPLKTPVDWRGEFDVEPMKLPPEPNVPKKIHGAADYLQAKDFVESVLEDRRPAIDVYDGANTSAACIAALTAAQTKQTISIPVFK